MTIIIIISLISDPALTFFKIHALSRSNFVINNPEFASSRYNGVKGNLRSINEPNKFTHRIGIKQKFEFPVRNSFFGIVLIYNT